MPTVIDDFVIFKKPELEVPTQEILDNLQPQQVAQAKILQPTIDQPISDLDTISDERAEYLQDELIREYVDRTYSQYDTVNGYWDQLFIKIDDLVDILQESGGGPGGGGADGGVDVSDIVAGGVLGRLLGRFKIPGLPKLGLPGVRVGAGAFGATGLAGFGTRLFGGIATPLAALQTAASIRDMDPEDVLAQGGLGVATVRDFARNLTFGFSDTFAEVLQETSLSRDLFDNVVGPVIDTMLTPFNEDARRRVVQKATDLRQTIVDDGGEVFDAFSDWVDGLTEGLTGRLATKVSESVVGTSIIDNYIGPIVDNIIGIINPTRQSVNVASGEVSDLDVANSIDTTPGILSRLREMFGADTESIKVIDQSEQDDKVVKAIEDLTDSIKSPDPDVSVNITTPVQSQRSVTESRTTLRQNTVSNIQPTNTAPVRRSVITTPEVKDTTRSTEMSLVKQLAEGMKSNNQQQQPQVRGGGSPPATAKSSNNAPMYVDDTGLILVNAGVL